MAWECSKLNNKWIFLFNSSYLYTLSSFAWLWLWFFFESVFSVICHLSSFSWLVQRLLYRPSIWYCLPKSPFGMGRCIALHWCLTKSSVHPKKDRDWDKRRRLVLNRGPLPWQTSALDRSTTTAPQWIFFTFVVWEMILNLSLENTKFGVRKLWKSQSSWLWLSFLFVIIRHGKHCALSIIMFQEPSFKKLPNFE